MKKREADVPFLCIHNCKNSQLTYHICNLILLPSSSIVLILKSIPGETKGWERKGEGREKGENGQVQAIPGTQFCVKCLYSMVSEWLGKQQSRLAGISTVQNK